MKRVHNLFVLILFTVFSLLFIGCSQKRNSLHNYTATKYTSAARHRATMRSYRVLRKHYYPTFVKTGETMEGISSWYGPNFHGKYTSNGEVYNMHARTAAHKTWPMDTMVKVRNLKNGKSTIVRINDRGPFVRGRIIDCSYAAGKEIGLDKMGIANVSIEVLGSAGKVEPSARIIKKKKNNIQQRIVRPNFGIQLGAFSHYAGAKALKQRYIRQNKRYTPVIKYLYINESPLYKVWLMGFSSEEEINDFKVSHNLQSAVTVRN